MNDDTTIEHVDGSRAGAVLAVIHESFANRPTLDPPATALAETVETIREALDTLEPSPRANLDHPYFAAPAPCTMLIDEVEALWAPIAEADDWFLFRAKLAAIDAMAEAYGTAPGAVPAA